MKRPGKAATDGYDFGTPGSTASGPAPEFPPRYDIYVRDDAVFRGPAGAGFITEVRGRGGVWKSYEGDRRAPVAFGDLIKRNVSDTE